MYFVPRPLSADSLVRAAVVVVFPWSTWPIVPTLTCGFVRSNLALAMTARSRRRMVRRRRPTTARCCLTLPHAASRCLTLRDAGAAPCGATHAECCAPGEPVHSARSTEHSAGVPGRPDSFRGRQHDRPTHTTYKLAIGIEPMTSPLPR